MSAMLNLVSYFSPWADWLQAYLLMKPDQAGVELPMMSGFLETAHVTWIKSCQNTRVSGLHKGVSRVLNNMGFNHDIEHVTEDQLFSVDIALTGR